jgi:integrase
VDVFKREIYLMWGTPENQCHRLFNKAMDGIGASRHAEKSDARAQGAKTFTEVAELTKINSYGTANTYLSYWKQLAEFAREKGTKDIEKISNRTVKSFLQMKIREDLKSISSVRMMCSAVKKMEVALNNYSRDNGNSKSYNWTTHIKNIRAVATKQVESGQMNKRIEGRGFEDKKDVLANIRMDRPDHILAATLQCETGARISEIAVIKSENLRGIGKDPYNNKESGVINVRGKGGKVREIYTSPSTYEYLKNRIENGNGVFKVNRGMYTNDVKEAAALSGQRYTGTHDFRHSWVQDRYKELAQLGHSDEQCLTACSEEIGHVRPDITEVYLK